MLNIKRVPSDYIQVSSGLGEAPPRNIVVLPVLFEGETKAVLELATFDEFDEIRLTFLEQLAESIGIVLNTIAANMIAPSAPRLAVPMECRLARPRPRRTPCWRRWC